MAYDSMIKVQHWKIFTEAYYGGENSRLSQKIMELVALQKLLYEGCGIPVSSETFNNCIQLAKTGVVSTPRVSFIVTNNTMCNLYINMLFIHRVSVSFVRNTQCSNCTLCYLHFVLLTLHMIHSLSSPSHFPRCVFSYLVLADGTTKEE
jgi:hypothetical protein